MDVQTKAQTGVTAVGLFLFFGATMAFLAGTTLVWPGTVLDRAWAINAPAYTRLMPVGNTAGTLFLLLGGILVVAGAGWWQRRLWGWRLAVAIIATQVLGDVVNAFLGEFVRGVIGLVIAGALLLYLLQPEVRSAFARGNASAASEGT